VHSPPEAGAAVPASPIAGASHLAQVVAGGRILEGEDFRERVLRAAAALAGMGIGRGRCVAILMRNDLPLLEVMLGTQHLGAYAVQLNWHATTEELSFLLNDCGADLLVAHDDLLQKLGAAVPAGMRKVVCMAPDALLAAYQVERGPFPKDAQAKDYEAWLSEAVPSTASPQVAPENIIYTSGTTGLPKGVRRRVGTAEQRAVTERVRQAINRIHPKARVLVPAPLYHTAPNIFAQNALRRGQLLVLPVRFDAEQLLRDIEVHAITHLYLVPTMFVRLLALAESVRGRYDLTSLGFVLHAGGPCPAALKRQMLDWWGPVIHEYYGSTETGAVTLASADEWCEHPGTIGRVLEGVRVEIHAEDGRRLGPGEIGELWVANHGYPDFDYINRPEARLEIARGELVATGDVGYVTADGYVFLCDRKKDMVISGGVNIYPAEIEAKIQSHPGVADCAVFGIPDEEFGEVLAAIVQPLPGHDLDPESIRAFVRRSLASYKTPRLVELRATLPREESGKIRKATLRGPFWESTGRSI
jgi:long-chain acyl-CoA synthetase